MADSFINNECLARRETKVKGLIVRLRNSTGNRAQKGGLDDKGERVVPEGTAKEPVSCTVPPSVPPHLPSPAVSYKQLGLSFLPNSFQSFTSIILILTEVTMTLGAEYNHKLPRICTELGDEPKCEMKSAGSRLICKKGYDSEYRSNFQLAKTVVLCSWSESYMDPEEIMSLFPLVQKLIIRNGNVSEFLTDFAVSEHLETLIMRNLLLETLRPTAFASLKHLKHLDLRNNRLTHLSFDVFRGCSSLSKVYLTDNSWNCASDLKWLLDGWANEKVVNVDKMLCGDDVYAGKPVYMVMFLIQAMESECPEEICSCSMLNIVWDTNKSYLVPVIVVDCSGRGLVDLPGKLPRNTTTLILKRNNITDLLPLVKKKIYSNVADIYFDGNNIGNIEVLEGALWLTKFRVLSLRGNRLRQLPTYVLDNAFEKNTNLAAIYLGGNPWKCDCMFTSDFQHLLIKYRSVIKDKQDIRCAHRAGDDNSLVPVLDVSLASVCTSSTSGINPLDIVSGVLAFLIVLVLGKLLYDYLTFKRTGKLPWIVAKMP